MPLLRPASCPPGRRRFRITKLPRFLVVHVRRFLKNQVCFGREQGMVSLGELKAHIWIRCSREPAQAVSTPAFTAAFAVWLPFMERLPSIPVPLPETCFAVFQEKPHCCQVSSNPHPLLFHCSNRSFQLPNRSFSWRRTPPSSTSQSRIWSWRPACPCHRVRGVRSVESMWGVGVGCDGSEVPMTQPSRVGWARLCHPAPVPSTPTCTTCTVPWPCQSLSAHALSWQ